MTDFTKDLLGGNLEGLLAKVQDFQSNFQKTQAELEKQEVEASSGGGMVSVKANGAGLVSKIKIDPSVINPGDADMLEDLIQAAVNEALRKAKALTKTELSKLTGGIPIPGL